MTVKRDISLNVLAKLDKYRREMEKIPGITEKEVAKAAVRMEKVLVRAEVKAARQAEMAAKKSARAWETAFGVIAGQASLQGLSRLASGFATLTNETNKHRASILDASVRYGLSAQRLSTFELAAQSTGLELSDLDGAFAANVERMTQVAKGSKEMANVYKALGIEVTNADGSLRSADDVMADVVSTLQGIEDPTERASAAIALFGEGGAKLNQVLSSGDMQVFAEMVDRYGTDISPKAAEETARWNRELASTKNIFRGLRDDIAGFAGGGSEALRNFNTGVVFMGELVGGVFDRVMQSLGRLGTAVSLVLEGEFERAATQATVAIGEYGSSVTDAADDAFEAAQEYKNTAAKLDDTATAADDAAGGIGSFGRNLKDATEQANKMTPAVQRILDQLRFDRIGEEAANFLDQWNAINEAFQSGEITLEERIRARQLLEGEFLASKFEQQQQINEAVQRESEIKLEAEAKEIEAEQRRIAELERSIGLSAEALETEQQIREVGSERFELAERQNQVQALYNEGLITEAQLREELVNLGERQKRLDAEHLEQRIQGVQTVAALQLGAIASISEATMKSDKASARAKKRAFAAQKVAAISETIMNTREAVMKAWADVGPALAPFVTPAVIAAGAAQVGVIAGQPMPNFHVGGVVPRQDRSRPSLGHDETIVRARVGEGFLTAQGVSNAGGEAGVAGLNSSRAGSGEMRIGFDVNGRTADMVVVSAMRNGARTRKMTKTLRPRRRHNIYDRGN